MGYLQKGIAASAAAVTVLIAGGSTKYPDTLTGCDPNSGYAISTQVVKTDSVEGTYNIRSINALSFNKDANVVTLRATGASSMQLNAYLKGTMRNHKSNVYWIQNTLHFVYSDQKLEQYLSSEVFRFDSKRQNLLPLADITGKGGMYSESGNATGRMTYIYRTPLVFTSVPQTGYLEMEETLKHGRIIINIEHQNSITGKNEAYDTIIIGKKGEFASTYFFSNKVFDAEMGFGGNSGGAAGYFTNTDVSINLYYGKAGSYAKMEYVLKHQPSTAETALDLSCRYSAEGYVRFYTYNYDNVSLLKAMRNL